MNFRYFFTGGGLLLIILIIHSVNISGASLPNDEQSTDLLNLVSSLQTKLDRMEALFSAELDRLNTQLSDQQQRETTAAGKAETKSLLPRSCQEALTVDPTMLSGNYYVDPDGTNIGHDPIYVYCNATTGATLVGHDLENKMDVDQCTDPGCYSRRVNYEGGATMKQLTALIDVSINCQQEIIYECFLAPLELGGVEQSWWEDRDGVARYFWDGVNINNNRHMCKCGASGDCYDKATKCNCDYMGAARGTDQGVLTDRTLLPVTNLNFGGITPGGTGRHQLGKLECLGERRVARKPTSCHDLYLIGHQFSGFYLVKDVTGANFMTVYCDFDYAPQDANYQTLMGFNDIKANALNTHSALPRNCRDVYLAGNQVNGYYFIDGTTGTTETVFCDFTQSPSSRAYQTLIGYNDIKPNPLNTHSALPTNCKEVFLAGNQLNGYYFINGNTGTTETVFCNFTLPDSNKDYQALVGYNDIKPNPLNTQKDYPTSCEEVFLAGNQLNGFYTIHQKDVLGGLNPFETVMTMLTVFCDFTKPDYYPGYETAIGQIDVKSQIGGVYFSVRDGVNGGPHLPIRFPLIVTNIGDAWHVAESLFIAPVDGVYFFSGEVTAFITVGGSDGLDLKIVFQHFLGDQSPTVDRALGKCKQNVGGRLGSNTAYATCSVSATLSLNKDNVISLRVDEDRMGPALRSAVLVSTRAEFTGYLLDETIKMSKL